MKILEVSQVKEWDNFTINRQGISSIELMERASEKVVAWLQQHKPFCNHYTVFCGPGNNGGDGLAIARLLFLLGKTVHVYRLSTAKYTPDFLTNLTRLKELQVSVSDLESAENFPAVDGSSVVIEALFGTGLNRPLDGLSAALVDFINEIPNSVISIDMPAGLPADEPAAGNHIIKASNTLCFQTPRLSLFFAESEPYAGNWQVLDIGLHPAYEADTNCEWVLSNSPWLHLKPYCKHAHKGLLGHAMISAGSREKMGAAVMAAKACLSSGSGLLTMAVPDECFDIIQTVTPEAMCRAQEDSASEYFLQQAKINAVAAGPGWSEHEAQTAILEELIVKSKVPLLIDATGLYHLAKNPSMLLLRPKGCETVITPHIGEFARLFGSSQNSFQRLQTALEKARTYNVFIVLKGAYTQVITPGGMVYFNSTGNPGMAKGGSGDVLTGLITGLLAQRYAATLACILGVYAHGLAGDFAAKKYSPQAMTPINLIACLPKAWKQLAGE